MEREDINQIIERYLSGKATDEEINILNEWYSSGLETDVEWDLGPDSEEGIKSRILKPVRTHIDLKKKNRRLWNWVPYGSAAAAILIALFTALFWSNDNNSYSLVVKSPLSQTENRYVLLPDSSIVIIRPGGELLVADDFGETDRQVELIGEAYFEVKPNKLAPFVINTGKIKTTVLGTAFSINASPNNPSVQVIVDHGKVRVDQNEVLLAMLQADQKLIVNKSESVENMNIVADVKESKKDELAWKESDMHFEAMAFGDLIKKLERRYSVQIRFKNLDISSCRMSGVFQGTEALDEVLTNLCLTSNTTFRKIESNVFEIEGPSCFN